MLSYHDHDSPRRLGESTRAWRARVATATLAAHRSELGDGHYYAAPTPTSHGKPCARRGEPFGSPVHFRLSFEL